VFCAVVWGGIRYLGYQEFTVAMGVLRRSSLRSIVKSQFSLREYETLLIHADTAEERWCALRAIGREFKFTHVELRLGGRDYEEQLDKSANGHWILHVPLSDSEYVRFMYQFGASAGGPAIASLADVLHRCLSVKKTGFMPQVPLTNGMTTIDNPHADSQSTETSLAAQAS
jgi:hypothetical protein